MPGERADLCQHLTPGTSPFASAGTLARQSGPKGARGPEPVLRGPGSRHRDGALGDAAGLRAAVPGSGRADRGRAGGAQPGAGGTGRAGYRQDRAAGACGRDGARFPRCLAPRAPESERELPFAALHQLRRRMPGRLDRLPGPQRDALGVPSGLRPRVVRRIVSWSAWRAEPAVGGGRRPAAVVPGRRCAVAGPGSGPGAGVRGPPVDAESVALVSGTRDGAAGRDLAGLGWRWRDCRVCRRPPVLRPW